MDFLTPVINNKDILWTLILLPMFWYFIRQNSKQFNKLTDAFKKHSDEDSVNLVALNTTLIEIKNAITNHNDESLKQFEVVKDNISKKAISKEDAVLLIKKAMLSGSYKKLEYLEKRLNKNNLKARRKVIQRQIRVELIKLSDEEYLTFLNWFVYNWVKLWDYVRKHFAFNEFIEEVFDCIFDENVKENSVKLKNTLETMKVYQSECIEKIRKVI